MKLQLIGHTERYALEQLQMALFPDAPMEYTEAPFSGCDGAVSTWSEGHVYCTATAVIRLGGAVAKASRRLRRTEESVSRRRQLLQQSYYQAAVQLLPAAPVWGALAGVRPTKLSTKHLLSGGTAQSCDRYLRDEFFISPERRRLCIDASLATVEAISHLEPGDLSVYVGIPFCPTRCAYCSFVSQSVERFGSLVDPYLEALFQEIEYTGKLLAASGHRVRTLYIGGGTPTTLSAQQMARLMDKLADCFDLSRLLEYTVEGGRPDTLDLEKLALIRQKGADRMSINPQTMNDAVLQAIGRRHTTEQTLTAYRLAQQAGFDGINMDLIAGLPGDTAASFQDSLDAVAALHPSNITVHTLALKKGADLFSQRTGLPTAEAVAQMMEYTGSKLREAGYSPYYLYRQKYMSGSFENVGWCQSGYPGLYNIYMMEELHTILSLGAGGMNKVNLPGGKIIRLHNPKYPQQYIERLSDVLLQKETLFAMLKEQC